MSCSAHVSPVCSTLQPEKPFGGLHECGGGQVFFILHGDENVQRDERDETRLRGTLPLTNNMREPFFIEKQTGVGRRETCTYRFDGRALCQRSQRNGAPKNAPGGLHRSRGSAACILCGGCARVAHRGTVVRHSTYLLKDSRGGHKLHHRFPYVTGSSTQQRKRPVWDVSVAHSRVVR